MSPKATKIIGNQFRKLATSRPLHFLALETRHLVEGVACYQANRNLSGKEFSPKVIVAGHFKTGSVTLKNSLKHLMYGEHEPAAYTFSKRWLQREKGRLDAQQWQDFLVRRHNWLQMEFEASGFLLPEIPTLHQLYPSTKFILIHREPIGWLRSMLAHILKQRQALGYFYWDPVFARWFGGHAFPPEEAVLQDRRLYPLKGLLDHYYGHYHAALDAVPKEQLQLLHLKDLSQSSEVIEQFLGLPPNALPREIPHLHRAGAHSNPLDAIDLGYINGLAAEYKLAT